MCNVAGFVWSSPTAACLTAEVEPNNNESSANTGLCSATNVTGSMSSSSDVDRYKFDINTPGRVDISLSHGSSVDFDWNFYAATGTPLASGTTSSNPETGNYTVATAGTYFVKVVRYSGTGSYTLNVKLPAVMPPTGTTGAVTGKVWLNGGGVAQNNTAIFVDGLRQATGKNTSAPNINSVTNCSADWSATPARAWPSSRRLPPTRPMAWTNTPTTPPPACGRMPICSSAMAFRPSTS